MVLRFSYNRVPVAGIRCVRVCVCVFIVNACGLCTHTHGGISRGTARVRAVKRIVPLAQRSAAVLHTADRKLLWV